MVAPRSFDLNAFVPALAEYILLEDLYRTNGLVNKRIGQTSFFFAVVEVFLDLFGSNHLR